MKDRAAEGEFRECISLMSAPPMKEGVLVGPPVIITARRVGLEDREVHVCVN